MSYAEFRKVVCPRHGVVHERTGQQLGCFTVIYTVLQQRLTDSLYQSAVDLPFHDHGVDDRSEVVHSSEPVDLDFASQWVDLHFADIGSSREGEVGRVIERSFVE